MTSNNNSHYARAEAILDQVLEAHGRGESVSALSRTHGLRREAIATVLATRGVGRPSASGEAVLEYVREHPGLSIDDLASRLGLSKSSISRYLRGSQEQRLVVSRKTTDRTTYSDEQMYDALRTAYSMLEDPSKGLSRASYKHLAGDRPDFPAGATFIRRWGTWSTACEQAGIPSGKARRTSYQQEWSDDDILDAVTEFIDATGLTAYHPYTAWAQEHGKPSGPLLVQRLGSWSSARRKVLAREHQLAPAETPSTPTRFEINAGRRIIEFEGQLLASSTSARPGSPRWIEFDLYRTTGGSYVLSRVGQTLVYHSPDCAVTARGKHTTATRVDLPSDRQPCRDCRPDVNQSDTVAVEGSRPWAQVLTSAEAVVAALHKTDTSRASYLTGVAARLLNEASVIDANIDRAYRIEHVA